MGFNAIIGDSIPKTLNQRIFPKYFLWGLPGCSVWDIELKNRLNTVSNQGASTIFLSCCLELNGYSKVNYIKDSLVNGEILWMTFGEDQRPFRWRKFDISEMEREILLSGFLQQCEKILEEYPSVILYPHAAWFYQNHLPSSLSYPSLVEELSRVFPEKTLIPSEDLIPYSIDTVGHLNSMGAVILAEKLESFLGG